MNNFQSGGQRAPKEPITNKWVGEGIIKTRTANDEDQIKFYPFPNGGGAIHVALAVTEYIGKDQNGNDRTSTVFVPVNVKTNKSITEQQLRGVRTGTKVRVVGSLKTESYTSKRTNQKVTTLAVDAYVFEILELPQQAFATPQNPYAPQGYQQPQYPQQQMYPQQGGAYPQQGGYPQQQGYGPQGYPLQPQYQQPIQAPQGYQQPVYQQPQAPQQQGYQRPVQPQQPQGNQIPPYYQAPAGPMNNDDDLPPGGPDINV